MYQTEEALIERLYEHYQKQLVFKEIGSGYGIADLVIIRNKSAFKKFLTNRNGILLNNNEQIKVFMYLRRKKKGVSFEEILDNHYISESKLKYQILKHLIDIGAVKKTGNLYYRNNSFQLFTPEAIAIEGKLSNWQMGLAQAIRYQRFAHKVYVALDQDYVHRVKIEEFKKFNVGLISVGPRVKEIISSEVQKPLDPIMRCGIAEKIIKAGLELNTEQLRNIHL